MGLLNSILTDSSDNDEDFIKLSSDHLNEEADRAEYAVKFGTLEGQRDVMSAKDEVASGRIVFLDASEAEVKDVNLNSARDELQSVVQELGGDIVETESGQFILTPPEVEVSRQRL